jgi:hypothetical protein
VVKDILNCSLFHSYDFMTIKHVWCWEYTGAKELSMLILNWEYWDLCS